MTDHHSRLARVIATAGGLGERLPAPGTTAGSLPAALVWWACVLGAHHSIPENRGDRSGHGGGNGRRNLGFREGSRAPRRQRPGADRRRRDRRSVAHLPGGLALSSNRWLQPARPLRRRGFLLFRFFDVVKPWPIRDSKSSPAVSASLPTTSPPATSRHSHLSSAGRSSGRARHIGETADHAKGRWIGLTISRPKGLADAVRSTECVQRVPPRRPNSCEGADHGSSRGVGYEPRAAEGHFRLFDPRASRSCDRSEG